MLVICPRLCVVALSCLAGLGLCLTLSAAAQQDAKGTASPQPKLEPTPTGPKTGLIPREVLFGNPDKAAAKISPDGKRLSFLAPVKGVLNVWVGPVDNPGAAKPVTNDKKRGIRRYFWAYTSQHILYMQDKEGDENFHIYAVNLDANRIEDLTPAKKVAAQIEGVSHKFPKEILVGLNERDERFHDVYKIDILTGAKKLIQKNEGFLGFITDDDFQVRFAVKFSPKGGQLIYEPEGDAKWKEFLSVPSADSLTTSFIGFNEKGDKAYLIDSRDRDTAALAIMDLKSKEEKILAADKLADVGGVMMHPTKNTVQAVAFDYTRQEWRGLDPGVARDLKKLKKVADGDFTVSSRTQDDRKWVVAFIMDNGPVRYYLFDRDSGEATFLFTNRKDLEGLALQKMHPVVITTRDGLKLVSYLTLPPGSDKEGKGIPNQPVAMVLNVHGGPWARDTWGYNPEHQFLANRGYAVLSVNYRGSTGFGKNFLNAANREWARKMHNDLIDAVDWAIKEKIAQPDKVAIMGGSYGGYATLVGLTFTPEKFACGVDIVGPSSLITLMKNIPPYWYPFLPQLKDRVGDFSTKEGLKLLQDRSPLNFVAKIQRPLLIGQGANDPRVKKVEADQIVEAMKAKKIPVTYVLFPDEGHGFARPNNRLAFYAVTEAFLARNLGGRFEAIGDAFQGSTISVLVGANDVPGLAQSLPKPKQEK
jgi:dipeptidyl aminopeptidase/acylaminoacyl peptidase